MRKILRHKGREMCGRAGEGQGGKLEDYQLVISPWLEQIFPDYKVSVVTAPSSGAAQHCQLTEMKDDLKVLKVGFVSQADVNLKISH